MRGQCRSLCAVATGFFFVFPWGVASFPQGRKPLVGPEGAPSYRRFHANDSLVGRPVPCTRDDKICFRHNLIFDPKQDICEYIGHDHLDCKLTVDREEFEHGSGRVVGSCPTYEDPCTGFRMAYDGLCYRTEIVRDVICGNETKPSLHILGDTECRGESTKAIKVQQPEEDGSCVIPDLRFPDSTRSIFYDNPLNTIQGFATDASASTSVTQIPSLKCESDQAECFSQGKVWVSGQKGCHALLEQGPCPEDHAVAMDAQAALRGRAEATCVHVRGGCPPGHKRMVFDGECHEDREIRLEAPGDATILRNQFGSYILISRYVKVRYSPTLNRDQMCIIQINIEELLFPPATYPPPLSPPCGSDNEGQCKLYEVVNDPPKPE